MDWENEAKLSCHAASRCIGQDFHTWVDDLGRFTPVDGFKAFALNAEAQKCCPESWRVLVSKLGGVPRQSSFLEEGEADGGKTEDSGMSWEASSGSVEQSDPCPSPSLAQTSLVQMFAPLVQREQWEKTLLCVCTEVHVQKPLMCFSLMTCIAYTRGQELGHAKMRFSGLAKPFAGSPQSAERVLLTQGHFCLGKRGSGQKGHSGGQGWG